MGKNKDRLNQKSIPWADSILDQVMNLPPAGGEDLQSTAEAQTTAVTELLKMVSRKVADHKGEGEFVWKKYVDQYGEIVETSDTVQLATVGVSGGELFAYYSDSYTYDESTNTYTLVEPTYIRQYANASTSKWTGLRGKYMIQSLDVNGFSNESGSVLIKVGDSANFSQTDCNGKYALTASEATVYKYGTTRTYIGCVVASDAEAYPNGGELGGYWYEREKGNPLAVMGYSKMAVDKFTFATRTAIAGNTSGNATTWLSHSLNEKPKFMMIIAKDVQNINTNYDMTFAFWGDDNGYNNYYDRIGNFSYYMSTTKARFFRDTSYYTTIAYDGLETNRLGLRSINSSIPTYFSAGVEYTLITMA